MREHCLKMVYELAKTDERVVFVGSDLGVGVLAEFNSVIAAVQWTAELQREIFDRKIHGPGGELFQIRAGIVLADVLVAGNAVFQVHVPLIDRAAFAGSLVAEYSVESLMRYFVPAEVSNRHAIALLDASDHVLASTVTTMPGAKPRRVQIVHDVPVAPAGNGLFLRGQGYRTSIGLISNTLFWMVVALSVLSHSS